MGFILAAIVAIILAIIGVDLTRAKRRAYRRRTYSADGHRNTNKPHDNNRS